MTNYNVPTELYPGRNHRFGPRGRYQRFPSLAEAVQFTVEVLPVALQQGSVLEAEEVRYNGDAIRDLYFSDTYPLRRAFLGTAKPGHVT